MTVEDLSPAIVRRFLDYVELDRHCSGATRNLRLSAIHSLARFIGMHSPVHLSWCSEVRSIPFKKTTKTLVGYLDKPEKIGRASCRERVCQYVSISVVAVPL